MRRRPRGRRVAAAVLLVGVVAMMAPGNARAAILWTLTASPLAATVGVSTTFTLTATNEDPTAALLSSSEIGCVVVDVPTNFSVFSATVTGSNAGDSWFASLTGNRVKVRAGSGGDRLALLGWVRFAVQATARSTGSLAWNANAYRQQDCSGSGSLLGVPPIVVVTGAVATPTPTPTPTPPPTSTPTPTPTPTPILTLPSPSMSLPLPTLPPPTETESATPRPTSTATDGPRPTSTARASASPDAASSAPPAPTQSDGGQATPGAAPPSASSDDGSAPGSAPSGGGAVGSEVTSPAVRGPAIRFDERRLDLAGASVGLLGGVEIWAVPAATIAVPGVLVLLWVAIQAIGAAVWMPAVRRLEAGDRPRSRVVRRMPTG